MTKRIFYIFLLLIVASIFSGCSPKASHQNVDNNLITTDAPNASNFMSKAKTSADKIEVIHFHATQQCWSCVTVGEYALKTIKERFPEEYKNGIITYQDINGELQKNRGIVTKYQAGGSSLFVNAITDNKDDIEEDVAVWRLISDETKFKDYFEKKLNQLLGK